MTGRTPNAAGRFLIATPLIAHLPFRRSVVFISEHDASGAVGVIVNAPSHLPVSDVLPALADLASRPAVVHMGGPVQSDTAVVLVRARSLTFARSTALSDIGLIDPSVPPSDVEDLRVFAGFSGWDDGQLEREITDGSWWVSSATAEDVFTAQSDTAWERAVRRLRGSPSLYATYPDRPELN